MAQPGQGKSIPRRLDLRQPGKSLADSYPNALIRNALHRKAADREGPPIQLAGRQNKCSDVQSNEYGAAFHSRRTNGWWTTEEARNEHRRNKHGAIDAFFLQNARARESNREAKANDRHNSLQSRKFAPSISRTEIISVNCRGTSEFDNQESDFGRSARPTTATADEPPGGAR